MASLTINGQVHAIILRKRDVIDAEERLIRRGSRTLLAALSSKNGGDVSFAGHEYEALCWGAWHRRMTEEQITALLDQFYAEGGTVWELHREVVEALVDSGWLGRRAPPVDPLTAGTSAPSGTSSPS